MKGGFLLFAVVAMLVLAPERVSGQGTDTLVLNNGRIWTEDTHQPEAQAVAIRGNRILAVGDAASMLKLANPNTRVVDLQGRRVVPGFNDAHVHFYTGGDGLSSVQLRDAASPQEMPRRTEESVQPLPKGERILNGNCDHAN